MIGRFSGEDSCLTLVWAVLDLVITNETNGIRFTQLDRQHLNRIRYHDPEQTLPEEASWSCRRLSRQTPRRPLLATPMLQGGTS